MSWIVDTCIMKFSSSDVVTYRKEAREAFFSSDWGGCELAVCNNAYVEGKGLDEDAL